MRIQQLLVSDHVKFFAEGYKKRWALNYYYDPEAPCLFLGVYTEAEAQRVKTHKGFKLVQFTGEGSAIKYFSREDGIHINNSNALGPDERELVIESKCRNIPIKSYEEFAPAPLGDKIYCYQGKENDAGSRKKYRYDILEMLINHFGSYHFLIGYQGHSMEDLIKNYYRPSFLNLQFNPAAGFTTVMEMAHMGRTSISNYNAPFCVGYNSTDDIIAHVVDAGELAKKNKVIAEESVRSFLHHSDDWLHTEYWEL